MQPKTSISVSARLHKNLEILLQMGSSPTLAG